MDETPPPTPAPAPAPAPPPASSTELRMKRSKSIWRLLLLSNLALGAILFAAKRRDSMEIKKGTAKKSHRGKAKVEVPPEPITSSIDSYYEDFYEHVTTPVKVRPPIPEKERREILQWMLEEKRKLKPKDPLEKKQIDEEKAILKHFLREKELPKF